MPTPESGESRLERLVYLWSFAAVYAGTVGAVVVYWRTSGVGAVAQLGHMALWSLLVVGKFIVFAPNESPWALAWMVWLIDLLTAFALASFLDTFEKAPVLGRWLRRARGRAVQVLSEYPRLGRMAFFGVATFVLLPLASTGAVSGSFVARILGLSRLAGVVAIALGSAGTALIFAVLSAFVGARAEEMLRSPVTAGAALVVLVVLAWIAFAKVKALLRR